MAVDKKMRDGGPYSARNASKGALLAETGQVIAALASGIPFDEVRRRAGDGELLHQRARDTRRTIWKHIYRRLFAHPFAWVTDDLKKAYSLGSHSPEFVSLVYLHYALSDHLTFDLVTDVFWQKWQAGTRVVAREDVLFLLDKVAEAQPQVMRWTDSSRRKLAGSILTALRDFGVLRGARNKEIAQPSLPLSTAEHLLRILITEGVRGRNVIDDLTWRLFFPSLQDVIGALTRLSNERRIHFERGGQSVVLETPREWEVTP